MSETVEVPKELYKNYLAKAEQMLNAMEEARSRGNWDACVLNAVHAAISAADAFCVYHKGLRNGSQRHDQAVGLFMSCAPNDAEVKSNATRLSRLIGEKSTAAYGVRMAKEKDADDALKDSERLVSFVKQRLPK